MSEGKLYSIDNSKKDKIQIKLTSNLSCNLWGKYWGEVSDYIRKNKTDSKIEVDLSRCYSADPFALMNIILDLKDIKETLSKEISFILPHLDFGNKDYGRSNTDGFKIGKFLKYLASQGFLSEIAQYFNVGYRFSTIDSDEINKIASYKYQLDFSGDVLFPFKLYELTSENSKDEIITDILNVIQFKFQGLVSISTYNSIREQIYNIVSELAENSYRHAYPYNCKKNIAIYIRRRNGFASLSESSANRTVLEIEQKNEKQNCPAIDQKVYVENSAFLELFFCDLGIGLKESLKNYFKQENKDYKYPVKELFYKVLKEGIRKDSSRSLTPFGGLHFICRIIRESHGYIWCNEGWEWVGCFAHELLSSGERNEKFNLIDNSAGKKTKGLNWGFRIPFSETRSIENSLAEYWEGKAEEHPVYEILKSRNPEIGLKDIICINETSKHALYVKGSLNTWTKKPIELITEFPDFNNDICIVWFPKGTATKNDTTTLIQKYCSALSHKFKREICKETLIIADIDQDRLFSFIYTFNEQKAIKSGFNKLKRIILITKMWEIVIFENYNGIFLPDREKARLYISNTKKNDSIESSLREYAKFIRLYDSYHFWNKIIDYSDEKIYINSQIHWGTKSIDGYLDLERAYLYPELYEIIETALLRTKGFSRSSVEYHNVDQTATRVCQNLNSLLSIDQDTVTTIEVCGASVTGYTFDASFHDSEHSIKVLLFAHPNFERTEEITTLFVWPSKDFFSSLIPDNEEYYRLGKTSLITKTANERLINTSKIYDNAIQNKEKMYADFQRDIPQVLRYGHYKTDKHHYLIGFDIISYIKYSYLKKEGAFVYFLWRIIYYLVGENYESMLYSLKDKEWIDVLQQKLYKKDSNHGALVVYHSNTYTEYIMKMIFTIIPDSLYARIIPISLSEVQAKGSPIAFSPLILDKIASTFKKDGNRGILFIDSSFSTGRRMVEIENVLLSTDCKKVSFLSLLDMRRLRSNDTKNSAYWKVNTPRLDDDGHCIICETLKELSLIENKVKPEYKERLSLWRKNWSCMNINNTVGNHGIENISGLNYDIGGISITNSVPLNLILSEEICESYNSDYIYRYITSKTDLSANIRIQLICTQLALYGNQNSRQLQLTLVGELIKTVGKSTEVNSYTSLASIILLSQKTQVIIELVSILLSSSISKELELIKSSLLLSENVDLLLVFAFHISKNYRLEQLINGYANRSDNSYPFISQLNELLLPNKELKQIFKDFEGIYVNEMGSRHSTNWQKLLKEHESSFEQFETRCTHVINEVSQMNQLVKLFPLALMNSRGALCDDEIEINKLVREFKQSVRNNISYFQREVDSGKSITQFRISKNVKETMYNLDMFFKRMLESYFICYSPETIDYFQKTINKITERYNKSISINFEGATKVNANDETKKYYYWNQGIEKEFEYLLQNVEHCDSFIDDENDAMMKVNIIFGLNEMLIELKSLSDIDGDQVKDAFLKKNRLSKEQALSFDVLFDFISENYNDDYFLLTVKMAIPACYQILKGEKINGK